MIKYNYLLLASLLIIGFHSKAQRDIIPRPKIILENNKHGLEEVFIWNDQTSIFLDDTSIQRKRIFSYITF